MYLSFAKYYIRYSLLNCLNKSCLCITDKLFTHSLKGMSNYAKYALIQYCFLLGQIDIYVYLSDCIPFPYLLIL